MRRNNAMFLWMCLAIVAAIVFVSHAVAAETKEITCTGKVVDAEGQPIKGAKVALYVYSSGINSFSYGMSPTDQFTTGSDGGFSFSVLADDDNYTYGKIVAEREGLSLGWASWNMRKGSVELKIELGQSNALGGVVVDENDRPVSRARVRIHMLLFGEGENKQYLTSPVAPTLFTINTDADGKFTFANLPLRTTADFVVEKTGRARINTWTTSFRLNYAVGQTDIKLVLPVEARIEGIVVEKKTGKSTAGIRLVVKEKNRWVQDAFDPKDDGTFSINSLAPGKYKLEMLPPGTELADWIAEPVEVIAETDKTTSGVRIELIKGGLLEFVVTDAVSGKPLDKVSMSVGNEVCNRSGLSGKDGIARIRLIPGEYYLFGAYRQGYSPNKSEDLVVIEDGKTERWEYTLFPESKITGIVRDDRGRPLEGVELIVWPTENKENAFTDAGGKFVITYDIPSFPGPAVDKPELLVLCRYEEGNLAATMNISEDTRVLDVKMKPGVTFTGNVMDPDGKGIEGANIYLKLLRPGWNWSIGPQRREQAMTDKKGKFEIKAIPAGNKYDLSVKAKGYGIKIIEQIDTDHVANNQLDMGNLTLALANLSISGVVVDDNDKPVAGVNVNTYTQSQPYRRANTDKDGRFVFEGICAGKILILAGKLGTELHGSIYADGGMTDIKIVISEKSSPTRYVPKQPASLVGKPLPELKDIKIKLPSAGLGNKRILICFWDMNQRPSRNCLRQLSERAQELKAKDIVAIAFQSSKIDENTLKQWVKKNNIPFPVGMIEGDSEKIRFTWGVRSLPWLILTDKQSIVRAEGFTLIELDEKLKANK